MVIKRNSPCPCGSGEKYKKCCGAVNVADSEELDIASQKRELIKENQQDFGQEDNVNNEAGTDNNSNDLLAAQNYYNQAVKCVDENKLNDAAEFFSKALSIQPAAEVYYNLATVQDKGGNLRDAVESIRNAINLKPDFYPAYVFQGNIFNKLGNLDKAIESHNKALTIKPDLPEAFFNLGCIFNAQSKTGEAIAYFEKALSIKPDFPEINRLLGFIYANQDDQEKAAVHFEREFDINPGHYKALTDLGKTFMKIEKFQQAADCFERAIAINPEYSDAYSNFGGLLNYLGDKEGAIHNLHKSISLKPEKAYSHFTLASLQKYSGNEKHINDMEELLSSPEIDDDQRILLSFALGKAWEDSGQYERAFEHLENGNNLKRSKFEYSIEGAKASFDHIKKIINKSFLSAQKVAGTSDETPIFIFGMPRSGTSLVEQIVASHSCVFGGGERDYVSKIIFGSNSTMSGPEFLENVIARDFSSCISRLADEYIKRIRKLSSTAKYITDKMPYNFIYLGFISKCFPNAKLIHCKRNPLDNCLSIFKNIFESGNEYAYNLVETGKYYKLYEDLMKHWCETLAVPICDVVYDDIIVDQKKETERLLRYCNLPWEDNCLSFYKTEGVVKTASVAQVRKPIYKGSVELWRKYSDRLGPLIEILSDSLIDR